MSTLLEKAKEADKRTIHKITPQIVELAVAWANEEISITQVKNALKVSENNKAYSILARALKEKIKKGDKKVELEEHYESGKLKKVLANGIQIFPDQKPPVEVVKEANKFKITPNGSDIAPSKY